MTALPSYKEIKEYISQNIICGVYEEGGMIETQDFYAEKFGVSRGTVRKAIYELSKKGVLHTIKGKGTFVTKKLNLDHVDTKLYNPQIIEDYTHKTHIFKLVDISLKKAEARIAKILGVSEDTHIIYIERVRIEGGIATNYQISYLNSELVKEINFFQEDLENNSLYEMLINKANLIPDYSDEHIRAVSCPKKISTYLDITVNEPILLINRRTYTVDKKMMEYCEDYKYTDIEGLIIRR